MNTGGVGFFNTAKDFGLITPEDGELNIFVHISALERAGLNAIVEGQKLNYEVVCAPKTGGLQPKICMPHKNSSPIGDPRRYWHQSSRQKGGGIALGLFAFYQSNAPN